MEIQQNRDKMEGIILSEERYKQLLAFEKAVNEDDEFGVVVVDSCLFITHGIITKDEALKHQQKQIVILRTEINELRQELRDMTFWDRLFKWPFE